MIDIDDFQLSPEELAEAEKKAANPAPQAKRPTTMFVQNRKAETWHVAGLSPHALWAWDILASCYQRNFGVVDGRMTLTRLMKRNAGLLDHRKRRRILGELSTAGLIQYEQPKSKGATITFVDCSGRTVPPIVQEDDGP